MLPPGRHHGRATCAECQKPLIRCVCALLPRVQTRTRIVILQHPRERRHPFGTAALAARAFAGAELAVAWPGDRAPPLPLADPGTWLLYPGATSTPLESKLAGGPPHTLVLIDGTWHTAPTLLRMHPGLASLPQVRLAPTAPSRYRIRAEPSLECLSTLESLVTALAQIEPATPGLDAVLAAFDAMVERQLGQLATHVGSSPRRRSRPRPPRQLPAVLAAQLSRGVLVYGESVAPSWRSTRENVATRTGTRPERALLQWTALRPATGEHFERLVRPTGEPPSAWHLAHLGFTPADLAAGASEADVARDFARFAGADTPLLAWNQSTLDLALALRAPETQARWSLGAPVKSIVANLLHQSPGPLEQVIRRFELRAAPLPLRGRAALRLAQCAAVVAWLRDARGP